MDAGQLDDMAHCTNDTETSTDCGTDGTYYIYSWDKSLIQTYLNNSFIQDLQSKGVDTNKIKKEKVCIDPSIRGSSTYSYGGYTKEEVDSVVGSCSKYGDYQIRLITASEFYNLSGSYEDISLPYEGVIQHGNSGKVAKLDGIERQYASWLYSMNIQRWWSMSSFANSYDSAAGNARLIDAMGYLRQLDSYNSIGVRPVITILK